MTAAAWQDNSSPTQIVHAISLDTEDYRQILSYRCRGGCGPVTAEFERNMHAVLGLLERTASRCTFFVTGAIAETRGDLLRSWDKAGHEIGCHGWNHVPIWKMTREAFRRELEQSKKTIEDALGKSVSGYRAAVFGVRWDTLWALDDIAESGFLYDSSIMPVRTRRYGVDGFGCQARKLQLDGGRELIEVPLTTGRLFGRQVPISGGGYFRLFPYRWVRAAVAEAQAKSLPFLMYVHPDELGGQRFDASGIGCSTSQKLRLKVLSCKSNIGRGKMPGMVERLLREFRFGTVGDIADRVKTYGTKSVLAAAGTGVQRPV